MADINAFKAQLEEGYTFKGDFIELGGAMLDGEALPGTKVKVPLRTLNRHGLIAGATGTGKTKTLQVLAEQMAGKGISVLLMDIKGDLSGLAKPGDDQNPKILERHIKLGIPFEAQGNPLELLTLSQEKGARLRATVSEFGPVLFSRILGLSETQTGIMALIFKYCDDNNLPLLDLADLKKTLQYISDVGKNELKEEYGTFSSASAGTILRKIIELEQQGAELFFGEKSFEVDDLCRFDDQGKGIISVIRLTDLQDRPKLFSTFMLQMLAEIYSTFPEEGDLEQPKLAIFIDEAHLVFDEASKPLLDQIESIVRLIRSKGVGVFFVTQSPTDIPDSVLGQLGLKVQHALRAFTAKDRKAIKMASENYPETPFYDVDTLITEMGIGEAFVTVLNEKGIPTPLVHTLLRAPQSRMDILTPEEIDGLVTNSTMARKYNEVVDRESAYEILSGRIEQAKSAEMQEQRRVEQEKAVRRDTTTSRTTTRQPKSTFEEIIDSPTTRQIGNTIARELTRGFLGILGIKKRR